MKVVKVKYLATRLWITYMILNARCCEKYSSSLVRSSRKGLTLTTDLGHMLKGVLNINVITITKFKFKHYMHIGAELPC
jgi:hypothetical protein